MNSERSAFMLDLLELEQLAAFADCGRLSKAAENLNISQPTITRTMQHLEEEFAVPLFERSKNRIALNETGWKAVEYAKQLLKGAEQAVQGVRAFDRSLHTISVSSCAPAPLWYLLPALSSEFPDLTVSSSIKRTDDVLKDLGSGDCHLAVLSEKMPTEQYRSIPFLKENLSVCVLPGHVLADYEEISFSELNGHNFLLASRLGFWDDLCRKMMPSSRFLVQTDPFAMQELIRESSLPSFVTDISRERNKEVLEKRIEIPISDPEAKITFYLVFDRKNKMYSDAFTRIADTAGIL